MRWLLFSRCHSPGRLPPSRGFFLPEILHFCPWICQVRNEPYQIRVVFWPLRANALGPKGAAFPVSQKEEFLKNWWQSMAVGNCSQLSTGSGWDVLQWKGWARPAPRSGCAQACPGCSGLVHAWNGLQGVVSEFGQQSTLRAGVSG